MCVLILCVPGSLDAIKRDYARLAQLAFRPGTHKNHQRQVALYTQFCQVHNLQPVNPAVSTLCYYVTYLSKHFLSAASVRNYLSGVNFMHKSLGRECKAMEAFPLVCLLRAVDVAMRRPTHQKLPITPKLLARLVDLTQYLGAAGPPMKVALLFAFFGMLRVSNIAPAAPTSVDPSRDTCRGDVLIKPPGLVVVLKWSKCLQTLGATPLIPLPALPGHSMDPLQAYKDLLAASPTTHPTQPLLTYTLNGYKHVLTSPLLNRLLSDMLGSLGFNEQDYSFHSLRRGGASTAYHGGVHIAEVKRHGVWASEAFWQYITAPVVAASPVAQALAHAVSTL